MTQSAKSQKYSAMKMKICGNLMNTILHEFILFICLLVEPFMTSLSTIESAAGVDTSCFHSSLRLHVQFHQHVLCFHKPVSTTGRYLYRMHRQHTYSQLSLTNVTIVQ